ncbi:MAG: cell division protein FtsZ [candidate division WOR-3 bacterium]
MIKLNESSIKPIRIKVLGIGGGGSNAVRYMTEKGVENVELIVANTDVQALNRIPVNIKIQLGKNITKGQGAGGDPEIGKKAAEESIEEIRNILKDADMIFLAAGLGGGTGSGGIPVIAKLCKEELNVLTTAVVTLPFLMEGPLRQRKALQALNELKNYVNSYIVIPNERLLKNGNENLPLKEAFKKVDEVLFQAVKGIVNVIQKPQYVNVDFADIKTVLKYGGKAVMGIGIAEGENRAKNAAREAIFSPLIDTEGVKHAKGVLLNIVGGNDLTIREINEVMDFVMNEVDSENTEIITGLDYSEEMEGKIEITLIASGISDTSEKREPNFHPFKDLNFTKFDENGNDEEPAILRRRGPSLNKEKIYYFDREKKEETEEI